MIQPKHDRPSALFVVVWVDAHFRQSLDVVDEDWGYLKFPTFTCRPDLATLRVFTPSRFLQPDIIQGFVPVGIIVFNEGEERGGRGSSEGWRVSVPPGQCPPAWTTRRRRAALGGGGPSALMRYITADGSLLTTYSHVAGTAFKDSNQ